MARLIAQHHVRVIVGKGGMGEATRKACVEHGCVYLHAVGGAASVIADRITAVTSVHLLNEFGPAEAVWELTVNGLEAIVTMDTRGRSIHDRIRASSKRALGKLLAQSHAMTA
jgi:fumarate hydratase subunit beta